MHKAVKGQCVARYSRSVEEKVLYQEVDLLKQVSTLKMDIHHKIQLNKKYPVNQK